CAPGGEAIVTTRWPDTYTSCDPCHGDFGGTSAAAPVVSGIAALLKSRYPTLLGEDLAQVITRTAQNYPTRTDELGYGLVRADAALNFLATPNLIFQQQAVNMTQVEFGSESMTLTGASDGTGVDGIPGLPSGAHSYNVTWTRVQSTMTFSKDY